MDDGELKRHFEVFTETADRKFDRVLEAVSLLDTKMDRYQADNRQEFAETRAMIKVSYAAPDQRRSSLESRVERIESVLFPADRQ